MADECAWNPDDQLAEEEGSHYDLGVDEDTGRLEHHCSRCGADMPASGEFCQVCAIETGGGEVPSDDDADPHEY